MPATARLGKAINLSLSGGRPIPDNWMEAIGFTVGTLIAERPRTDPCSRNSRTRLLPRLFDGEARPRPWTEDTGPREPFLGVVSR